LGWNVYGWNKYNINYRLVFKFNYHYSTEIQILKRAAWFSLFFITFLILYVVLLDNSQLILSCYAPLFVWIALFGYIFFPSKHQFNPKGRKYFRKIIGLVASTPFLPIDFRITFSTDQLVSFVGPLKDL
jgi:hypothetical protein